MGTAYQTCDAKDSRKLAEFLAREGQVLLPMLDLVTRAEVAVDEVIEVVGRATLEAVLLMSPSRWPVKVGQIAVFLRSRRRVIPKEDSRHRFDHPTRTPAS